MRLTQEGRFDFNLDISVAAGDPRFIAFGVIGLTGRHRFRCWCHCRADRQTRNYFRVSSNGAVDPTFGFDWSAPPFTDATVLPNGRILVIAGDDAQANAFAPITPLTASGAVKPDLPGCACGAEQDHPALRREPFAGECRHICGGDHAKRPDCAAISGNDGLFHLARLNPDGSFEVRQLLRFRVLTQRDQQPHGPRRLRSDQWRHDRDQCLPRQRSTASRQTAARRQHRGGRPLPELQRIRFARHHAPAAKRRTRRNLPTWCGRAMDHDPADRHGISGDRRCRYSSRWWLSDRRQFRSLRWSARTGHSAPACQWLDRFCLRSAGPPHHDAQCHGEASAAGGRLRHAKRATCVLFRRDREDPSCGSGFRRLLL